jgi:hypothetical protein
VRGQPPLLTAVAKALARQEATARQGASEVGKMEGTGEQKDYHENGKIWKTRKREFLDRIDRI